jgi:DEAD/DEAH box helicase domain-containing protein
VVETNLHAKPQKEVGMNSLTLDLETRCLAQDLPGSWDALKRGEGGASAAVVWHSPSGRPYLFDDHDVVDIAEFLENTEVILSFNGVEFDIPVIEGLLGRSLDITHHIDIYQLCYQAMVPNLRRGFKLGELAERTIGRGKTGDGAHAPKLANEGRFGQLFNYCLEDVILTRDLATFIQNNGGVIDTTGELLPLDLPEWFSEVDI